MILLAERLNSSIMITYNLKIKKIICDYEGDGNEKFNSTG